MTRTRRQHSRRDKQVCSGCYHQPLCSSPLDGARGGVAVAPLGFLLIEAETVQYRCRVPNDRHEWMRVGNVTQGADAVRGGPGVVVHVQSPWAFAWHEGERTGGGGEDRCGSGPKAP